MIVAELVTAVVLVGAAICWVVIAAPELPALWEWLRRMARRLLRVERVRVDLAQGELRWLSPGRWIGLRWGLAALAGLLGYLVFGLVVIGLVAALAAYQMLGLALEARRRQVEARRQQALLDAMRFGISVMSRAGGALQMLQALSQNGPVEAQPIFRDLIADAGAGNQDLLLGAVQRMRERLADPLFDDLSMVLTLHWKQGGKLVPALEVLVTDWNETLRLQREAKALRAGIEASVLLLTALPFVFLFLMHLMAPALLAPLGKPVGEVVFAIAVGWTVLGYRVLQRMSEAPREERIAFNEAAL
jgi:tight adherence protein B